MIEIADRQPDNVPGTVTVRGKALKVAGVSGLAIARALLLMRKQREGRVRREVEALEAKHAGR